jgi:DNA-binding response OmpR family regulator
MLPTAQKIHTSTAHLEKIPLLVVSTQADDYSSVRQILQNASWQIDRATSIEEAGKYLQHKVASVILCERDLPDGTWKDLLAHTRELALTPSVLVVSRHADDDLWADVLSSGGYDVLPKPFDRREVVRVIGMAWRHSFARNGMMGRPVQPALAQAASNN